jgi:hypothetical protein
MAYTITRQSIGVRTTTQQEIVLDLDYEIRVLTSRNQRALKHLFELCARISGQQKMLKKLKAERAAQSA